MLIHQMVNNKGNPIKNQFVIYNNKNTYFISYDSTIAKITPDRKLILGKNWNYSHTTLKYLYEFLKQNEMPNLANKTKLEKLISTKEIKVINKENFK